MELNNLDLFKNWTPGMLDALKNPPIKHIGMLGKRHTEEAKRKISNRMAYEIREKISQSLLGKPKPPFSEEHKARLSESATKRFLRMSKEEKKMIAEKRSQTMKAKLAKQTQEEREEWVRGWHEALAKAVKEGRAQKSPEFKRKVAEALGNRMKVNQQGLTEPERLVDNCLKVNFPNRWAYNGNYSLGITIGGRIPDFVGMNGRKEIISVMGGLGFFHFLDDEKIEVAHYAEYGYKCVVVWEWDCYIPGKIEKLVLKVFGPEGLIKVGKENNTPYYKITNMEE